MITEVINWYQKLLTSSQRAYCLSLILEKPLVKIWPFLRYVHWAGFAPMWPWPSCKATHGKKVIEICTIWFYMHCPFQHWHLSFFEGQHCWSKNPFTCNLLGGCPMWQNLYYWFSSYAALLWWSFPKKHIHHTQKQMHMIQWQKTAM